MRQDIRREFAFFHKNNNSVLYHIKTSNFYRVFDSILVEKFKKYFHETAVDEDVFNKLYQLEKSQEENCDVDQKAIQKSNKFVLNRLALVLTSDCNLRCTYCYANFGMYGYREKNIMSEKSLERTIDYFTKKFKKINAIQFFGGEPTLCENQIKYVVEKFAILKEQKNIDYTPSYGLVTNGVRISEQLMEIFKKYNFVITLSVDGPRQIHDSVRRDLAKRGSFDIIKNNYEKMKKIGIEKIAIESTYTNEHVKQGVSLVDVVNFCADHFGDNTPHVVPVAIDEENELSLAKSLQQFETYLVELVNYTFKTLLEGRKVKSTAIVAGLIQKIILKQHSKVICPAGGSTLSVSNDMTIQPCFMYTSEDSTAFGNLDSSGDELLEKAYTFNEKINNKRHVAKCQECFMRSICTSCLGDFQKDDDCLKNTNQVTCSAIRIIGESILLNISEIKADEHKWKRLHCAINGVN